MKLKLSRQEAAYLREALGSCVTEMHTEIVHTDNFDMKNQLKFKRDTLREVLLRMQEAEITSISGEDARRITS